MKFKKCISMVLAAVMTLTSVSVPVFAGKTGAETYNYVALGDSIAAGYGLTEGATDMRDPALVLTEELIANPISDAYPAVFGEKLASLGAEMDIPTKTTNLSATAYRAEDVAKTIQQAGYKGEIATMILDTLIQEGSSVVLEKYHDIYTEYLSEADLVSIQLGGNDIVMAILVPLLSHENPVLRAVSTSLVLVLFGMDAQICIGAGIKILQESEDELDTQTILEAMQYFEYVGQNANAYVMDSARQVEKVVRAVKGVNAQADIALIGMFNPYGNSLEYEGMAQDFGMVIRSIAAEAVKLIQGGEVDTEELAELWEIVGPDVLYPIQYLVAGKSVEPQMKSLNQKLAAIAKRNGATFVDVYSISNECNLDPHPTAEGHAEIAELLYAAMKQKIIKKMDSERPIKAESVTLNRKESSLRTGDTLKLKAVVKPKNAVDAKITWISENPSVAEVSADGLVTAKTPGTTNILAVSEGGLSASCSVKVEGRYVYECEKNGKYRYTTSTTTMKSLRAKGWTCKKILVGSEASIR